MKYGSASATEFVPLMGRTIAVMLLGIVVFTKCQKTELSLTITYPQDNDTVQGLIVIAADVSDAPVDSVVFYVDDVRTYQCRAFPYRHIWNTFALNDSSLHAIYAKAYGDDNVAVSETVTVMVDNDSMVFADDFELYASGAYPYVWNEIWAGAGSAKTHVTDDLAHHGAHSFKLIGSSEWVRTDAVSLNMNSVDRMVYECAIIIPSSSYAGAIFGFYVQVEQYLGTIYNGVLFNFQDTMIHVRGLVPVNTGFRWMHDTWYRVTVVLDYENLLMDVWIGSEQIAASLEAASRDSSHTFAVATEYGAPGVVYYDCVSLKETGGRESVAPAHARPLGYRNHDIWLVRCARPES